jgi:hypothetical protein
MCQSKANGGRRCKPNKGPRSSAATVGTSGYMSQGLSGEIRRTRRAVLRDAKEQLGGLLDSVVDAAPLIRRRAWCQRLTLTQPDRSRMRSQPA